MSEHELASPLGAMCLCKKSRTTVRVWDRWATVSTSRCEECANAWHRFDGRTSEPYCEGDGWDTCPTFYDGCNCDKRQGERRKVDLGGSIVGRTTRYADPLGDRRKGGDRRDE